MSEQLTSARQIRARGPGSSVEALRVAYLDLLKLALCDLAGVRTESVVLTIDGEGVVSRETSPEELEFRVSGKHWPRRGLTMVGMLRLDDLQECTERVVADRVPGDLIEAGVWRGGASILMRATLDTLDADDRVVCVADSFAGFPGPRSETSPPEDRRDLSHFDFMAVPLEEVRENFTRFGVERGVSFVPGYFDQTMPALRYRRWALIRLDGDTYGATRATLEALYPGLSAGGYLIVDDYELLPECRRAVDDYRNEHGITEPIERVDWTCVRWRRESDPVREQDIDPLPLPDLAPAGNGGRREARPIPTQRERELEAEADQLRRELTAARQELESLGR